MYLWNKKSSSFTLEEQELNLSDLNQFHTFKSCELKAINLLAGVSILHTRIIAEEELAVEELDGYDSEDEVKEKINNQNVENVLQRVDHTIKYRLNI